MTDTLHDLDPTRRAPSDDALDAPIDRLRAAIAALEDSPLVVEADPVVLADDVDDRDAVAAPGRRSVLGRVTNGVLALVATAVVAMVLVVVVGPRVLPYQTVFVQSGSMRPTLEVGSMVVLARADSSTLEVGDVVTFAHPDHPGTLVTHRIHAVEASETGRSFVTKGDANDLPDSWRIPATGTGWRVALDVPHVGYALGFLTTGSARLGLLAVPAIVLGFVSLAELIRSRRRS